MAKGGSRHAGVQARVQPGVTAVTVVRLAVQVMEEVHLAVLAEVEVHLPVLAEVQERLR